MVLWLPMLFDAGLHTSIVRLDRGRILRVCGVSLGSLLPGNCGSAFAAHLASFSWREAGSWGILMNTPGLLDPVLVNVALEIGAIPQTVFALLAIAALVATIMTAPVPERLSVARLPASISADAPAGSADRKTVAATTEDTASDIQGQSHWGILQGVQVR